MKRKLAAECLESRQMLHGGGFGHEAKGSEEAVAEVFDRFDTNDDGVILVSEEGGDEISERIWNSIAEADVEGSEAGVTVEELTAHLEAKQEERAEQLEAKREAMRERMEEQREKLRERLEETQNRQKQRLEEIAERVKEAAERIKNRVGQKGNGGGYDVAAMVDRLFESKDVADPETGEVDGLLSAEELGGWADRLAEVAGEDGMLSKEELTEFTESKMAEHQERWGNRWTNRHDNDDDKTDDTTNVEDENDGDDGEVEVAASRQTSHSKMVRRVRSMALARRR